MMFTISILLLGLILCALLVVAYLLLLSLRLHAADDEAAVAEGVGGGERGLTAEELERLEEGKMGVGTVGCGGDCAVCCDKMEETQAARVLPGCLHAFHRSCIDAWLQCHPSCPLCRARLSPPPDQPQPQPQSPSS